MKTGRDYSMLIPQQQKKWKYSCGLPNTNTNKVNYFYEWLQSRINQHTRESECVQFKWTNDSTKIYKLSSAGSYENWSKGNWKRGEETTL